MIKELEKKEAKQSENHNRYTEKSATLKNESVLQNEKYIKELSYCYKLTLIFESIYLYNHVAKIYGLENLSLRQRLNSFKPKRLDAQLNTH